MNTDDMREFLKLEGPKLLEQIKANRAKLDSCPRHLFNLGEPPYKLGQKHACSNCGGELDLTEIYLYTKGYKAAGRDPNEVIPGFE